MRMIQWKTWNCKFITPLKQKKSPGYNGIAPIVIQKIFNIVINLSAVNYYSEEKFLESWKISFLVLVPKLWSDKLRPIAMLPIIRKIFEKMIKNSHQFPFFTEDWNTQRRSTIKLKMIWIKEIYFWLWVLISNELLTIPGCMLFHATFKNKTAIRS